MRVDIHAHSWADDYLDPLDSYGRTDTATQRGLGAGAGDEELDARFALNDSAGTAHQVLSVSPQVPHFAGRDHPVTAARHANDLYAMILAGIPSRYPNVRIIDSHLGGALPMLIQRADNQYGWESPQTPEKPSVAARRMWFDTVSHGHVLALRAAAETVRRRPARAGHRGLGTGLLAQDILRGEGVHPDAMIFCHGGPVRDLDDVRRLVGEGSYVGFDRLGSAPTSWALAGEAFATRWDLTSDATHEAVRPEPESEGVDLIRKMAVGNIRRFLTGE